jgi:hypothetical protein
MERRSNASPRQPQVRTDHGRADSAGAAGDFRRLSGILQWIDQ